MTCQYSKHCSNIVASFPWQGVLRAVTHASRCESIIPCHGGAAVTAFLRQHDRTGRVSNEPAWVAAKKSPLAKEVWKTSIVDIAPSVQPGGYSPAQSAANMETGKAMVIYAWRTLAHLITREKITSIAVKLPWPSILVYHRNGLRYG